MEVYKNPNPEDWESLLKRPTASYEALEPVVSEVFGEVALKGDEALKRYTEKFDGISLSTIPVDESEIQAASKGVSEALKQAITQAKDQITAFHLAQKNTDNYRRKYSRGALLARETPYRKSRDLYSWW